MKKPCHQVGHLSLSVENMADRTPGGPRPNPNPCSASSSYVVFEGPPALFEPAFLYLEDGHDDVGGQHRAVRRSQ